jgi:hypothetical protein
MCCEIENRGNSTARASHSSLPFVYIYTYPYFDVVAGLVWSNDPESYAGGSTATDRVSLAGQGKVMTQTKRGTLVLQLGGWA